MLSQVSGYIKWFSNNFKVIGCKELLIKNKYQDEI